MKKINWKVMSKFLMLILFVGIGMVFTSCSDDDKENGPNSEILGTWKLEFDEELWVITFKSDNTLAGEIFDFEYDEHEKFRGTYTYDSNDKMIFAKITAGDEVEYWSFEYRGNYLIDDDGDRWYKQ